MILLCSISCSELNGDCAGGNDDSFIQSSIMCSYLSWKIRLEAPKRQRGKRMEREDKEEEKEGRLSPNEQHSLANLRTL
jgi:hypothetical protein